MNSNNNGFNTNNQSTTSNSATSNTSSSNFTANSLVNLIGAAVSATAATSSSPAVSSLTSLQTSPSVTIALNTSPSVPPPPIPLSSSLPASISSSLAAAASSSSSSIVHIASISQLQSALASSSSSSSSSSTTSATVNTQLIDPTKMDTSGPINSTPSSTVFVGDIIARLYPNVNQQETPLPRQWSSVHKCQTLQLSNNNLRVTYKGPGKTHKDAASVRTDYPIPAACGIYYYEVKIISKGRDGYMGIGLSKSDVQLNRLPGWDKNSYGYHGDDGHSFCCSGTGQNYGPTFTTGDIIGCCLNLIENTCFYTKNGYNLGIAFRDLPSDLYPTVGLQTPSESVEANFGQYQFEFDIHNYIKEWHLKTRLTIERFPLKKETENNLPIILRKLISTYLVHHGYSSTAEAFAKSVGHVFEEELASIRNRQRIQKLVLNGNLGEAIDLTYQLFPGILERNSSLLFALKVRQFIEMINSSNTNELAAAAHSNTDLKQQEQQASNTLIANKISTLTSINSELNTPNTSMLVDTVNDQLTNRFHSNGNSNNGYSKFTSSTLNEEAMEMDASPTHTTTSKPLSEDLVCTSSASVNNSKQTASNSSNVDYESNLHKILQFGRELFQMNNSLDPAENQANTKMLRDAFSLLAYHDPWNSPLGYQLDQSQREPISALLNSAILEANNMPRIPPLEVVYGQTSECMRLMSKYGIAWCAYVNLNDYMTS